MSYIRNVIENAIGFISPTWALNRAKARFLAGNIYRYDGASHTSNIMRNNNPGLGSASADYPRGEQDTLVARCRDAHRNKPIAKGAVDRLKHWVVGTGLDLQSRIDAEVLGMDEKEAARWERKIERHFRHWAKHCDLQGFVNFRESQLLNFLSVLITGNAYINTTYVDDPLCRYSLRLHFIDTDRISNPNWTMDTKQLRNGIDLDEVGKPITYNVLSHHPNDTVFEKPVWEKVPVFGEITGSRRFFHIFERERADQFSGIPYLAPVLEPLLKLEKYTAAELTAAIVSSLFTVFVKTEGGMGIGATSASTEGIGGSVARKTDELELGDGAIMNLQPNESIEIANPSRPNTAYDPFWHSIMKQISAALSQPLDVIVLAFSSSYSAARAALLTLWRMVEYQRANMMEKYCQPIYELWFEEFAYLEGIDIADPLIRAAWTKAIWIGQAKGAIDEKREVAAASERIKQGISTLQIECEQIMGADWYDIQVQRKLEKETRKEFNIEEEDKENDAPIEEFPSGGENKLLG